MYTRIRMPLVHTLPAAYEDYETGNYEPKLMKLSEVDKDVEEVSMCCILAPSSC